MDSLFLQTASSVSVKLHPVVAFQIIDHFVRRGEDQKRVIGTLLGSEHAGVVEVRSCFAVPHDERESVRVGRDYHANMLALHQRVKPQDKVVGWYSTSMDGEDVSEFTCVLYDVYADECANPLHLLVDTSMKGDKLSVKAFMNFPITVAETEVAAFQQVPIAKDVSDAERIALSAMVSGARGAGEGSGRGEGTVSLSGDLAGLEGAMSRLKEMLSTVSTFVDEVVEGKREASPEVGRRIADTLAAVPHIEPAIFERVFNDSLQDLLMVVYLSQLTNVQVAIAEKLSLPTSAVAAFVDRNASEVASGRRDRRS